MFDWDDDFDDLVRPRAIKVYPAEVGPDDSPSPLWRWLAGGVLMAGIAYSVSAVYQRGFSAQAARAMDALAAMRATGGPVAPPVPEVALPPELLIYGQTQFEVFARGITQFANNDLLAYAGSTSFALSDRADPMTPYHLDALFLIYREMDRRALSRPMGALPYAQHLEEHLASR